MKKAGLYYGDKLIMEVTPFEYPELTVVPHHLTDYQVVISREDGYYLGSISGEVWRVCGVDWCYTSIFPTKEAAEDFAKQPIMYGGYGYGDRDNRRTNK